MNSVLSDGIILAFKSNQSRDFSVINVKFFLDILVARPCERPFLVEAFRLMVESLAETLRLEDIKHLLDRDVLESFDFKHLSEIVLHPC